MADWIMQNLGTILITAGLVFVVILSIRSLIKNKKQGKSCCGGSCAGCSAGCSACGHCPPQDPE